jgi:spore photoproduct lyase
MTDFLWPKPQFDELFIHEDVWESPVAVNVRSLLPTIAQRVSERPYKDREGTLSGLEFDHSKKRLYLSSHEGHFFRKCPGTQGAACCNYFVLNLGVQCNMNCSYCYLQSYINSPLTQIYTNIEDALQELDEISLRYPKSPFRVGTGEVIDSLSLDDLTLYSKTLVKWFKDHPALTCEFKTKSSNIKNFINEPHSGNVVVSFSINPQKIIESEEHLTASLQNRLEAARRACEKGFPVAFHIDPMIYVEGWEDLYSELVDQITTLFKPKNLKWISVGALRYQPDMKHILRERFPDGKAAALQGEFFLSDDGKLRYDQKLRSKMFKHVISDFHKRDKSYPVFLCMEAPESWIGTYNSTPRQVQNVSELFRPMALNL